MKKQTKYILVGLILVTIVSIVSAMLFGLTIKEKFSQKQQEPNVVTIDDEDLRLSEIKIPKKNNLVYEFAFTFSTSTRELMWPEEKEVLNNSEKIYWPDELGYFLSEMKDLDSLDRNLVNTVLERNQEIISKFDTVMQGSSTFRVPIHKDPKDLTIGSTLLSYQNFEKIAGLNILKAQTSFQDDDHEQALERIIKVMKLGYLMQNEPNHSLMQNLKGITIEERAIEELKEIVAGSNLPSEKLSYYISESEYFKRHQKGTQEVLKFEYQITINTKRKFLDKAIDKKEPKQRIAKETRGILEEALETSKLSDYSYESKTTSKVIANHFRPYASETFRFYKDIPKWELPESIKKLNLDDKEEIKNVIGKVYLKHNLPVMTKLLEKSYELNFKVNSLQLLLALKTYQSEGEALPNDLKDLTPDYIENVPLDPFDGRQIRYSKEKKIIYSVGKDLKDNEGNNKKDLVTEIKF